MAKSQPKYVWSRLSATEYLSETVTGKIVARVAPTSPFGGLTSPIRTAYVGTEDIGDFVNVHAAKAAVEAKLV